MGFSPNINAKQAYCLIALFAAVPRFLFIFLAPELVGDGMTYSTVAENIFNGCGVSLSPVGSGECVPHFGGSQGPGYPFFIALMWWFSGHSDLAVRLAQGIIYVVSILYLVNAVWYYASSPKLALLIGLILALSPLEVAWPRYIFTETLAMSGALWLFAELIKSLHESKLRVIPIAITLIASTFIRMDGILLVVPVAVAGFMIHRPMDAIRKGIAIALILGLPWVGWMARNVHVGLTNIIIPPVSGYGGVTQGYFNWMKTWSVTQYQFAAMIWPKDMGDYDQIRVDEFAYYSEEERVKVLALLEELKGYSGKPFPAHIDDQFADLAKIRINDQPFTYFFLNPLKRTWALWSNIYDSLGWPVGLSGMLSAQDRLDIANGGIESKLLLIKKYPMQVIGKAFVNSWRVLLYLLFIVSLIIVYKDKEAKYRDVMTLVLSFWIARSVFSGLMNYVETRYIMTQLPLMEMVVLMVITEANSQRKMKAEGFDENTRR